MISLLSQSCVQVANFEEVVEDADENTAGGNDEIHELTQKNAIILSPYRVNPSYRRPAAGTDSDHGYSTMTPMGDLDSEIVPYVDSTSARNRLQRLQKRSNNAPSSIQSMTSGNFYPSAIATSILNLYAYFLLEIY